MRKRAGRPEIAPSQRREAIFRFVATKTEAAKIRAKAKASGSHDLRILAQRCDFQE